MRQRTGTRRTESGDFASEARESALARDVQVRSRSGAAARSHPLFTTVSAPPSRPGSTPSAEGGGPEARRFARVRPESGAWGAPLTHRSGPLFRAADGSGCRRRAAALQSLRCCSPPSCCSRPRRPTPRSPTTRGQPCPRRCNSRPRPPPRPRSRTDRCDRVKASPSVGRATRRSSAPSASARGGCRTSASTGRSCAWSARGGRRAASA